MVFVDVIIPVFNTPLHFLAAAIESLRGQSHADWIAWMVDDGSEKAYATELERLLRRYGDSRIRYLSSEHKGPAGSRNVGIQEGRAPYVAFLDSDDCWLPHHLSRQIARLEANNEIALVHGHSRIIDSKGTIVRSDQPHMGLNDLDFQHSFVSMLRENYVNASSVVVRRNWLETVGNFDDTFPCLVDKELWLRLLNSGAKFYYDSEVVLHYRVHPQNISKKTDLLMATRRRIIDKAETFMKTNPRLGDVDWPSLKHEMQLHMHREAADAHFVQGRYRQALKYAFPTRSGFSWHSCALILRALIRTISTTGSRTG